MRRDIIHAFPADIDDPAVAHSRELVATAHKHVLILPGRANAGDFYRRKAGCFVARMNPALDAGEIRGRGAPAKMSQLLMVSPAFRAARSCGLRTLAPAAGGRLHCIF
jgi:hypothetical protein